MVQQDATEFREQTAVVLDEALRRGVRCAFEFLKHTKPRWIPAAAEALRAAAERDPALPAQLANRLIEESPWLSASQALTLLDILVAAVGLGRIRTALIKLLSSPDACLASKAALLLAQGNASAHWLERQLQHPDPRVRANVIEAHWDQHSAEFRRLFQMATRDPNNRVVGNALVALYRSGDVDAREALLQLAQHREPRFRATAAWAMGETEDDFFLNQLHQMAEQESGPPRLQALRALQRIRRAAAKRPVRTSA